MLSDIFETSDRLIERTKGAFEAHHHQPAHKVIQVTLLNELEILFSFKIFQCFGFILKRSIDGAFEAPAFFGCTEVLLNNLVIKS